MRRSPRRALVGSKRPTSWQGGNLAILPTVVQGGSLYHAQMSFPFSGIATVGMPTMLDAVLQKTNLEFSYSNASKPGESYLGAYGVQVAEVDDTGTLVTALNSRDPLTDPDHDWVLHGYCCASVVTSAYAILGAQFGGPGVRVESKAKRKLRDDEILIFSYHFETSSGVTGDIGTIVAGWRLLFKGR